MKNKTTWILLPLLLTLVVGPATAERQTYVDLPNVDLVDPAEIAVPANRPDASREAVTFTWALDPAADLNRTAPAAPAAQSREYWLRVTPEQLRAGVALPTTSASALVRVQAVDTDGRAMPVDIQTLRFTTPSGVALDAASATDLLVDAEQMDAMRTFAEGTSAFRFRSGLGAGEFVVSGVTDEDPGADIDSILFHVFEPESDVVLSLRSQRGHFLHKNVARFTVELAADASTEVSQVEGFLAAPSGNAWPVTFTANARGQLEARVALDASGEAGYDGLWQIEAVVEGSADGRRVRRAAHVAFDVALPTARVMDVTRQSKDGMTHFDVAVEAAVAGRYEVRGVLYGTDREGQSRPLAMTHSAAWLEAGQGALTLSFDAAVVEREGFGAPYEIRDLSLLDQGRMSLLLHQESGSRQAR